MVRILSPFDKAPHDLPILWFPGPGVTAHNGVYVVSRAAISKKTGTPAGVGMPRGRFLRPGETVRLWIEKIGELTHRVA